MKNIFKFFALIPAAVVSFAGCQEEPITVEEPKDFELSVELKASAANVVLELANADNEAVSFTWTDNATDVAVDYTFTLYQTDNKANATEPALVEGKTVAYKVGDLNALLLSWGVVAGEQCSVTAEVSAQVADAAPVVKTAAVNVTTYDPNPGAEIPEVTELYIVMGEEAYQMNASYEDVYYYSGVLPVGQYKLVASLKDENAFYNAGDGKLSYAAEGTLFENTSRYAGIEVDIASLTITVADEAPAALYVFVAGTPEPVWTLDRQEGDVLWYFGNFTEALPKDFEAKVYASFNQDGSFPFSIGEEDSIVNITDPETEATVVPEAWAYHYGYDCATASVVLDEENDKFIVRNLFIPYSHGDEGQYNADFPFGYLFPIGDCIADAAADWDHASSFAAFINTDRYAQQADKMLRPEVFTVTANFKEVPANGEGFKVLGNWDWSGHITFTPRENGINPIYEGTDPNEGWTAMDWWGQDYKWKPDQTGEWDIEIDVCNIRLRMVRPSAE